MARNIMHIGRLPDNTLVVAHPKISSKHCLIKKIAEGEYLIEDLDSTNGTFVNGRRIKQTIIKPGDELELADMLIDIKIAFSVFNLTSLAEGINYGDLKKQETISTEFSKLKAVYEKYVSDKKKTMTGSTLTSTGLRAGLSLIPFVGNALGIVATGMTGNVQAKLYELDEKFKKNYICPVCFKFLGNEPFDNLEKRGTCFFCKSQWKKEL